MGASPKVPLSPGPRVVITSEELSEAVEEWLAKHRPGRIRTKLFNVNFIIESGRLSCECSEVKP